MPSEVPLMVFREGETFAEVSKSLRSFRHPHSEALIICPTLAVDFSVKRCILFGKVPPVGLPIIRAVSYA